MDYDTDAATAINMAASSALTQGRRRLDRAKATASGTEAQVLLTAFSQLEGDERTLLVRIIAQVAKLEREQGEEMALAMLESAMARMGLTHLLS